MAFCKCTDGHCADRLKAIADKPSTALIKKSLISKAGKGLFAERDYKSGEFVTFYSGCVVTEDIEGDRVLQVTKNRWIDGSGNCTQKAAPGDYINHKLPPNTKFMLYSRPFSLACIRTTKKVLQGDEFYIDYGKDYWDTV